ncbi:unnamed protein product [Didymodactylos carnosus]|uniref:Uncharacterized protein n=1 Tax=Didymodactylos carnosus TaxID=1234261 RepID=A0A814ZBB6_9BILA|nr:unnamed protein product [Didymodactylos carnosus]CAF1241317.1 unnamed protein product [Didymodactylos carnosus]CAF3739559.1 unnamed protein product [Didymodactylos carnosus]CAF4004543.1 unnamed protein product [Didymodactylos carnosus]
MKFIGLLVLFITVESFAANDSCNLSKSLTDFLSNYETLKSNVENLNKKVNRQPYVCMGNSPFTKWARYEPNGIQMNIDTSKCHFSKTPAYFTSLGGMGSHYGIIGTTSIYFATSTKFQIFLRDYWNATSGTLMKVTADNHWNVNWIGVEENN